MGSLEGNVVSVFVGAGGTLGKCSESRLEFAFDGIVGDRHRGLTRKAWELTDKQPGGTERRNERQWSAVAQEDLDQVSEALSLNAPLSAGDVAVNLSISGVADFSRLPRGTTLVFEGGVVLMVEEYNPVGEPTGLADVVRDENDLRSTAMSLQHEFLDRKRRRRIEARGRLVQQHNVWVRCHGAGEGQTLLLTPRK